VIAQGFENCCISNTLDETGGDALWDEIEEDGNVRSECEEDESAVCEDADSDTNW
jgi:hypothetical protein